MCALLFTAALGAMRWFARFSPEAHASTMCADARDTLCGSITLPPLAWRAVFFSATFGAALPYYLLLCASRRLRVSLVALYGTFQPVSAAIISGLVVMLSPPPHLGVESIGGGLIVFVAGVAIVVALALVVYEEARLPLDAQPTDAGGLLPGGVARSSDVGSPAASVARAKVGDGGSCGGQDAATPTCEMVGHLTDLPALDADGQAAERL